MVPAMVDIDGFFSTFYFHQFSIPSILLSGGVSNGLSGNSKFNITSMEPSK